MLPSNCGFGARAPVGFDSTFTITGTPETSANTEQERYSILGVVRSDRATMQPADALATRKLDRDDLVARVIEAQPHFVRRQWLYVTGLIKEPNDIRENLLDGPGAPRAQHLHILEVSARETAVLLGHHLEVGGHSDPTQRIPGCVKLLLGPSLRVQEHRQ